MKVNEKKVPESPLGYNEEKSLREEAQRLRDIKDGVEVTQGVQYEAKDNAAVATRLKQVEATLSARSVTEMDLSPEDRRRAMNEEVALREDLQKDMPTWKEYSRLSPRDGAVYTNLVNKIAKWDADPIRRQKIRRWKTLRRLLDPHNPKSDSTVHLFPQ